MRPMGVVRSGSCEFEYIISDLPRLHALTHLGFESLVTRDQRVQNASSHFILKL